MWRIGKCTNSSYGCEIYEMRNLRFNKGVKVAFYNVNNVISPAFRTELCPDITLVWKRFCKVCPKNWSVKLIFGTNQKDCHLLQKVGVTTWIFCRKLHALLVTQLCLIILLPSLTARRWIGPQTKWPLLPQFVLEAGTGLSIFEVGSIAAMFVVFLSSGFRSPSNTSLYFIIFHHTFNNTDSTWCWHTRTVQLTLVISTSLISNNRLSRSENLVPA